MPRNGSGTYSLPAGNPVVTGTTVSSTVQNTTMSDIATAITQSLAVDGQTVPTANLPMGGFKLTGLGAGSSSTDSANFGQTINMPAAVTLASAATVNIGAALSSNITISGTTTITAFDSVADGITRNVTFSGVLALTHNATSLILPGAANIATAPGDCATFLSLGSGNWRCIKYLKANGEALFLNAPAVTIASSATTAIGGAASSNITISGTTGISAFDNVAAGITRIVKFSGALTLTYNATSLILPGATNITTAAGDQAIFRSLGSGNWECVTYQKASGLPAITKSYDSGDQTITASSGVTLAHGLGTMPKIIETWLHCLSADVGYGSGDYVKITGCADFDGTNSKGVSIIATSVGLVVRFGSAASTFNLVNATTGVIGGTTNSKWAFVIRAYA